MKCILVFFVGLVCGAALLAQTQRAAFASEMRCFATADKTSSDKFKACEAESDWLEFVQML